MPPPVVSAVNPDQGSTSGGTVVTVTGVGFTGAFLVRFGTKPAASFTVNSDTQITAVTPSGTGTVNVIVTSDQGNSTQQVPFTYVSASQPTVTSVQPSQGPTVGGTSVTLTGANFTGATAVRFDGVNAPSFTVNSATRITTVTPAHPAGAAPVTVTTPGGTSNPSTYIYLSQPTLTSLTPAQGPAGSGTVVTLSGTNLTTATAVRFGTDLAQFVVVSPTRIEAVAPPGTAGSVTVTVITPAGTSNGLPFNRVAAPGI